VAFIGTAARPDEAASGYWLRLLAGGIVGTVLGFSGVATISGLHLAVVVVGAIALVWVAARRSRSATAYLPGYLLGVAGAALLAIVVAYARCTWPMLEDGSGDIRRCYPPDLTVTVMSLVGVLALGAWLLPVTRGNPSTRRQ